MIDMSALHVGLAMGATSIVSVGPNNLMLLREGIARGRIVTVASLVLGSYVVLVSAAVFLGSSSFRSADCLSTILSWGGLVALIYFAGMSFRAIWVLPAVVRPAADES